MELYERAQRAQKRMKQGEAVATSKFLSSSAPAAAASRNLQQQPVASTACPPVFSMSPNF